MVPGDDLEGWDGGREEVQKGGDIYVIMTDSRHYTAKPTQHWKAIILQ